MADVMSTALCNTHTFIVHPIHGTVREYNTSDTPHKLRFI
jgi:hypothetical protein